MRPIEYSQLQQARENILIDHILSDDEVQKIQNVDVSTPLSSSTNEAAATKQASVPQQELQASPHKFITNLPN